MIPTSLLGSQELDQLKYVLLLTNRQGRASFDVLLHEFQSAFPAPRGDDAPVNGEQPSQTRDVLFNALCSVLILLEVRQCNLISKLSYSGSPPSLFRRQRCCECMRGSTHGTFCSQPGPWVTLPTHSPASFPRPHTIPACQNQNASSAFSFF